ncbi:hypothetical protein C8R43DRAFT_600202 [Mycena crocata]|nr:hypothetical protein C8R43DRAFT_600202 [Mycena crocata]
MSQWARLLWLLPLVGAIHVSAETIRVDDRDPRIHWSPDTFLAPSGYGLNSSRLENGTATVVPVNYADFNRIQMEMNFTAPATGAGLSLFFALPPTVSSSGVDIYLDKVKLDDFSSAQANGEVYNVLGYESSFLLGGNHTVGMIVTGGMMFFDYALIRDGNVNSSSSMAGTPAPTSPTSSHPSNPRRKTVPVGAIVGDSIGGIVLVISSLVGLLRLRRARRRAGLTTTTMVQSPSTAPPSQAVLHGSDPLPAQRIQLLEEELSQLRGGREASTAALSDPTSVAVGRSLSTMKREQIRAVQEHQLGHFAHDALVHTDSGLRLTAGRLVDELPPTYAAN